MKIALISCVSKKLELTKGEFVPAKDLYTSSLFKMAYAHQKLCDKNKWSVCHNHRQN